MSSFSKHIEFLAGSSRTVGDDRRALEQWAGFR